MYRPMSKGNGRRNAGLSATDAAELDRRILRSLGSIRRKITARELADYVGAAPRCVVGRLQALKRQGAVAFTRNVSAPSAPGLWTTVGWEEARL